MAKTIKRCEKTLDVMSTFSMKEKVENLVKGGATLDKAVKVVNSELNKVAFDKVVNNGVVDFLQLSDKVYVEQIDENLDTYFAELKVNKIVIIKKNSKSTKILLPSKVKTLLTVFGANILDNKLALIGDESLPLMKRFVKIDKKFDCFLCDTCTSNNKLEEQLQVIFNELFGENVIKAKKTYVAHLRESFVKAIPDGYKNGNELALLQLVLNHSFDAHYNIKYTVKSGLETHKEPKTNK